MHGIGLSVKNTITAHTPKKVIYVNEKLTLPMKIILIIYDICISFMKSMKECQ
jgi:hypothetical protein